MSSSIDEESTSPGNANTHQHGHYRQSDRSSSRTKGTNSNSNSNNNATGTGRTSSSLAALAAAAAGGGGGNDTNNSSNRQQQSNTNGGVGTSTVSNTYSDGNGTVEWIMDHITRVLDNVFSSCADDPKGSVHRAWSISLLFVLSYFILSVIEMWNLRTTGPIALVIAAVLCGLCHVVLGILGTFVLKRFPTSFSIGFLLGTVLVLANQNLIFFGTFYRTDFGSTTTNQLFGLLGLILTLLLTLFGILLFHFRNDIVVAAHDVKMSYSTSSSPSNPNNNTAANAAAGGGSLSRSQHPISTTITSALGIMGGGGGGGTGGRNSNNTATSNYVQYDDDDDDDDEQPGRR